MHKYQITIEIETDQKLKFPVEAQLLNDMQVQTESLNDGTYGTCIDVKITDGKVIKLS